MYSYSRVVSGVPLILSTACLDVKLCLVCVKCSSIEAMRDDRRITANQSLRVMTESKDREMVKMSDDAPPLLTHPRSTNWSSDCSKRRNLIQGYHVEYYHTS